MGVKLYGETDVCDIAYEIRKKYGARLPNEYAEVDYIQSTGGARIASGVSGGNDNIKIQCKFLTTSYGRYSALFGNYSSESANCTRLIFSSVETSFLSYVNTLASSGYVSHTNVALNTEHVLEMTQGYTKIDNNKVTRASVSKGTDNDNEISIFSARLSSTAANLGLRFYYFKIYNGDILLRDFIPCYRKSDNKVGFYDMVSNSFYYEYNDVGSFTYGSELYSKYKVSEMPNAISGIYEDQIEDISDALRDLNNYVNNPGYTRIEYLESSGTQYLDLDFVPKNDTKIEIDYECTDIYNYSKAFLYGSRQTTTQLAYCGGYCYNNGTSTAYSWCYGSQGYVSVRDFEAARRTIYQDADKIYLDGIPVVTYTAETFNAPSNRPMYLYATNATNFSTDYIGCFRIYSCKVYDGSTLVRNLIPVSRDSDDALGMLDLENNVFYANAGTGTFTGGDPYPFYDINDIADAIEDIKNNI